MPTDEERFYSHIQNRALFDEGIKVIAGNSLARMAKLMVAMGARPSGQERFMLTMGAKRITEEMILALKESFADVDKFMMTGETPEYIDEETKRMLEMLLKMRRDITGI